MMEFRVPMQAPSTPNLREHHMSRARRVKSQRGAVSRKMPPWKHGPLLTVRITRVAPRLLDSDNLQGAMKAIRDQVAAGLRIDDASPLVEWEYHQTIGEPAVVIQAWPRTEADPSLPVGGKAAKRERKPGTRSNKVTPGYTPPRQPPGDARLAEVFAPPNCDCVGERHATECIQGQTP